MNLYDFTYCILTYPPRPTIPTITYWCLSYGVDRPLLSTC